MLRCLILMLLTSCAPAWAGMCDWPVPSYTIGVEAKTGLSKAQFNSAIDEALALYGPIFERWECPLVIVRSWGDSTINAQAWRSGGKCYVEMFGGLARDRATTYNSFLQVITHEIGHHLGGRPYYGDVMLSVEGQADYYATRVGMPALGHQSYRSSQVLADQLARWGGESPTWLPGPPLPSVRCTMESHPYAQCRRVTFEAGRIRANRPTCWYSSRC